MTVPRALAMANAYAFAVQHARINSRDDAEVERLRGIEEALRRLDDRDHEPRPQVVGRRT